MSGGSVIWGNISHGKCLADLSCSAGIWGGGIFHTVNVWRICHAQPASGGNISHGKCLADLFGRNFLGNFWGRMCVVIDWDVCLDPHAGLQDSTYSGHDLRPSWLTHRHTERDSQLLIVNARSTASCTTNDTVNITPYTAARHTVAQNYTPESGSSLVKMCIKDCRNISL